MAENEKNDVSNGNDDIPNRESWTGRLDFILSCIGYAVGLGNVWRFPYLCYQNGGGAFLIPYVLSVFIMGIPIFMMEVTLGQFMTIGGLGVWKMCPIFKGVGWAATIVASWLNIYYIVVISWALFYLFSSFTSTLPWSLCNHKFNTDLCVTVSEKVAYAKALVNNQSIAHFFNKTNVSMADRVPSSQEFWFKNVLEKTGGIDEIGGMRWQLLLTLGLAWILCYFCIWQGIKQTGKVVYFTALFPYVVLFSLLIRGITLPGAADGVSFYLSTNFTKLGEASVWMDAGSQVFFSYGVALGSLIALGSYNKYNNNCYRDALVVGCVNSCTSLFAGFVIFSNLGFMALMQGKSVADVAREGPGLLFQVYPEVVTLMPYSPLWSFLFFFMILLVGLDSQFCTVEGVITALVDEFPKKLRKNRAIFILVICVLSYLIGLTCVTKNGIYVFNLFDSFSANRFSLLWLAFFETISVGWFFGARNLLLCLEDMIGYRPFIWWMLCWAAFTPLMIAGIFFFTIFNYETPKLGPTYTFPKWSEAVGWLMALSSMLVIPIYAIYALIVTPGSFNERIKYLFNPTPEVLDRLNAIKAKKLNGEQKSNQIATQGDSAI